jgi:5-methylcytosine-specific restriction endonuclease McrA
MPTAPPRACLEPRCPGFAVKRGRCLEHYKARERAYNKSRDLSWFYNSWNWRLSRQTLAANPCCVDCGEPATQADHLVSVRQDPSLALEPSNVVSRCRRCHSARTSRYHSWNR